MSNTDRTKKKVTFSSRRPNDVVSIPPRSSQLPPTSRKYGGSFNVKTFRKTPSKCTGKNTMFCRFNASFFLLEYKEENDKQRYNVHTNDEYLQKFTFSSDRKLPNRNFVISSFVHGIFRFLNIHRKYDEVAYLKHFKIVLRHMHEQYNAIVNRTNRQTVNNNNQTRTFFRFSLGQQIYYFGFHLRAVVLPGV